MEPLEQKDDEDGYPEKLLPKNSPHYLKERDIGPRFAQPNSFEFEFGQKWKQLFELEKQKRSSLETEILNDRERLDDQMEFAIYEHETNMLRESEWGKKTTCRFFFQCSAKHNVDHVLQN